MNGKILVVGLGLILVCMAPAQARPGRHSVTTVDGKMLRTNGSGPCVVKPINEEFDWYLSTGTTEIALFKGRGTLAYKPEGEGKDKGRVFLAGNPGKGTEWKLTYIREEAASYVTIQATSGKVKGWYLTAEEKGEDFTDGSGKKVKSFRVYLSEKPTKHSRWRLNEISP